MSTPPLTAATWSADLGEAAAFLGPILRPQSPESLALEYPLVFQMPGRSGGRLLRIEERTVAGAVFAAFDVATVPAVPLRIGAIGSVGTHPDHRGKGHAGAVLRECEEALREQGCALAVLWSNVPEVFRKNGYREAGVEIDFVVFPDQAQVWEREEGVVLPFDPERDLQHCWELYRKHPVGTHRALEEFRALVTVPGMKVWVHKRMGRLTAYACVGKGADFPEAIHEWAGPARSVLAIVKYLLMQNVYSNLAVISSAACEELVAALRDSGSDPLMGYMGMMKALDRPALAAAACAALEAWGRIEVRAESDGFRVAGPSGSIALEDEPFLRFLFGFRGANRASFDVANAIGVPELREAVPLQMFLWGLDSV